MDYDALEETYNSLQDVLPDGFDASKPYADGEIRIFKDGREITSFDPIQASTVTLIISSVKSECLEEMSSQNEDHLKFLGDLKEMLEEYEENKPQL